MLKLPLPPNCLLKVGREENLLRSSFANSLLILNLPVPPTPALDLPDSENPKPPEGLDFTTGNWLPTFPEGKA